MEKQLTPTEQRLLRVLADGVSHSKQELLSAIGDSQAEPDANNLRYHISKLRDKLPVGLLIITHEDTLHTYGSERPIRGRTQGAYRLLSLTGPCISEEHSTELTKLLDPPTS